MLVFDFLLSLFFPLYYFVLFISDLNEEASPSVLLSAELVNLKPPLAELTGNLGPETEGTGWATLGNCPPRLTGGCLWFGWCIGAGNCSLLIAWVGPLLAGSWVPFSIPLLPHSSSAKVGKTPTHIACRILGDFNDVMRSAPSWEQDCEQLQQCSTQCVSNKFYIQHKDPSRGHCLPLDMTSKDEIACFYTLAPIQRVCSHTFPLSLGAPDSSGGKPLPESAE